MAARYAIGIDFGTESGAGRAGGRRDGRELAHGLPVPERRHRRAPAGARRATSGSNPTGRSRIPRTTCGRFQHAVPAVLADTGVDPADVIGIGIDFTACTMLPTTADGTPLCSLPELRRDPHAWVKLWKHHAAQPEADRINAVARERGEPWLPRYGGKISSEWFFARALQILDEAPDDLRAPRTA